MHALGGGAAGGASGSITAVSSISTRFASERVGLLVTKGTLAILPSPLSRGDASASNKTDSLLPGAAKNILFTFEKCVFHSRRVSWMSCRSAACNTPNSSAVSCCPALTGQMRVSERLPCHIILVRRNLSDYYNQERTSKQYILCHCFTSIHVQKYLLACWIFTSLYLRI